MASGRGWGGAGVLLPPEEGLELRALPFFFFQSEKQPSGGFFFQALGKFF